MATLDDSPSQFPGISWSSWAEIADLNTKDETEDEELQTHQKEGNDSMKLNRQEMSLYGLCPARDELFLVVCEKCGQVIKPQALQRHMEVRHGESSPPASKGKRSSSSSTSPRTKGTKCGSSSSSSRRNHTNPVVKVERISSDVVRQKLNKKTIGYDTERPRPPEKPGISLDSEEVKELLAITPDQPELKSVSLTKTAPCSPISVKPEVITIDEETLPNTITVIPSSSSCSSGGSDSVIKEETITLGSLLDTPYTPPVSQEVLFNPQHTVTFEALKDIFEPTPPPPPPPAGGEMKEEMDHGNILKSSHGSPVPTPSPQLLPTPPASVESKPSTRTLEVEEIKIELQEYEQKSKPDNTPPIIKASSKSKYHHHHHHLSSSSSSSSSMAGASYGGKAVTATPSMLTVTSSITLTTIAASPVTTATLVVTSTSSSPAATMSVSAAPPAIAPVTSPMINAAFPPPIISTAAAASSHSHIKTKDPRFLPCKDRIYDAEKHCGVWMEDSQRHCTRSLTCKTHALSLRRSVSGRSKSFDQLLLDHRAAKEAAQKAKQEAVAAAAASRGTTISPAIASVPTSPATTLRALHTNSVGVSSIVTGGKLFKASHVSNTATSAASSKLMAAQHLYKPVVPPVFPPTCSEGVPLPDSGGGGGSGTSSRLSSDGEDEEDSGPSSVGMQYITHHPRPAAVNGFGSWLHGPGYHSFSRKTDLLRSAFAAAVDRHLHPPPHKKLCVEAKLPAAPSVHRHPPHPHHHHPHQHHHPHHQSAQDPYEFSVAPDHPAPIAAAPSSHPPPPPAAIQAANTAMALANKAAAKSLAKSKSSPAAALPRSFKLSKDLTVRHHAPNAKINALTMPTSSAKRKRSGSANSASATGSNNNSINLQNSITQNSITLTAGNNNTVCFAPTMNLAAAANATNATFNATLSASKVAPLGSATKLTTNHNLLKDLNIVVTGVDGIGTGGGALTTTGLVNGQLVSIPSLSLADMTTHLQLNNLAQLDTKHGKNKGVLGATSSAHRVTLNSNAAIMTATHNAITNPSSSNVTSTVLPNGVLNSQTLSQLKGFPISINTISAMAANNRTSIPNSNDAMAKLGKRPAIGKLGSLTSRAPSSNGAGNKTTAFLGSAGVNRAGQIPLSVATAQQLAAAMNLAGPRLMTTAATPLQLHHHHATSKQALGSAAKGNSLQPQPVSLTIVTPQNMGQNPHPTLLLQTAPAPPPEPPQEHHVSDVLS